MLKKIMWSLLLATSVVLLVVVLPIAATSGNSMGFVVLGGLFWAGVAYLSVKKLRAGTQ